MAEIALLDDLYGNLLKDRKVVWEFFSSYTIRPFTYNVFNSIGSWQVIIKHRLLRSTVAFCFGIGPKHHVSSSQLINHAHLLSENVSSREDTSTFSVIPKQNALSQ
jgi:polysaccharide pyruvyl transferase WcaK-like protein